LSAAQLEAALDEAVLSKGTAELAFIYLIDRYEFDLDALKGQDCWYAILICVAL
jgi:hypothetical protein